MATVKTLIGNIKGKPGADGDKNVYSTSETVIGTWNGATLYRKMMRVNIPNTPTDGTMAKGTYSTGISYTKIKSVYLNEISVNNYVWSTAGMNDRYTLLVYAGDTNVFIENFNTSCNGKSCYIVIEYIK